MSLVTEAERIAAEFDYTDQEVNAAVKEFIRQLNEGLEKNATTMSQIPTFVTGVPNGTEKGLYLAVDLGGTNFRVCSVQLHGDTTFSLTQSKVPIPRDLMLAKTGKELFAFLAKQIELFLKTHHEDHFEAHIRRRDTVSSPTGYRDEHIFNLGFTFSFPVHQVGINRGTLIRWTKGFDIPDVIGQDVCALLQAEIDALHLPVRVAALVNDTVGTLMSRSYTAPGKTATLLGAIFGTGTNGAYVEKLSKLTKPLEGPYDNSTGEMVVNTEWGSFDNQMSVLPSTKYDRLLDEKSVNPGVQMFEKRVSGMFLGEILRLVMVSMIEDPTTTLFKDDNSSTNDIHSTTCIAANSPIYTQWAVDSSILSVATADNSAGLRVLRQELDKLGIYAASIEDAEAIKIIASAIGRRAARLSGIAVGAIVLHTGRLDPSPAAPPSAAIIDAVKAGGVKGAAGTTMDKLATAAAPLLSNGGAHEGVVDIGVDGSLVEFYPGFEDHMRDVFRAVEGIGASGEPRIRIGIAKDGSGVGAALIAQVATRMDNQDENHVADLRRKLTALQGPAAVASEA